MKNLAFLIFMVSSFMGQVAWGQCEGNIYLETQEAVDNFVSDYGCSVIEGDLIIGFNEVAGITNINELNALSIITSIEGNLIIMNNPNLINFNGLENITILGGLIIHD